MLTRLMPLVLLIAISADAQLNLPFPKRGSKNKQADDAPLDTLKGTLRSMTATEILVEADDKRMFTIVRNDKTKFLEKEDPVKVETIKPGDRLMIDASQDDHGRWTAVEVRVTKRGSPEDHARARVPVPTADGLDPAKDPPAKGADPAKAPAPAEPPERPSTEMAPRAPKSEVSEEDRPKLSRGKPSPRRVGKNGETEPDEPIPVKAEVAKADKDQRPLSDDPRDYRAKEDAPASAEAGAQDSFIEKAREVAYNFSETLPAYTVKQFTTRFQSDNPRVNWQPIDNVSTDVVYENGKENYRNTLINGKPPKTKIEDSGSWSTGEFATVLRDIFSTATAADFRPSGAATIVNHSTRVYKFVVEQENSHWRIVAPGQFYFPSYKGTIWVDKESFRVLRIEMSARNMPKEFSFDTVESTLDYDFIRLGTAKTYLLPVHAENLICVRHTSTCSRNVIDFRNYRKFGAESTIIFK